MKRFYIASSFQNVELVRNVSARLKSKGYIETYDWTRNKRATTIDDLQEIGQKERTGVMEADFLIVLLPAGKGSHVELGIALAQSKKVFLFSKDDSVLDFKITSTFYHLPEVEIIVGSDIELTEKVLNTWGEEENDRSRY